MLMVDLEYDKNKILVTDKEKAIEIATQAYFNGKQMKINGKIFDIFDFGNYKEKLYNN